MGGGFDISKGPYTKKMDLTNIFALIHSFSINVRRKNTFKK